MSIRALHEAEVDSIQQLIMKQQLSMFEKHFDELWTTQHTEEN